jgi:8-oxo-dGTP diphosphatase
MIECSFEDGGKAHLRHITVNALVIKDHQLLLGKRGTYKGKPLLESGKWGFLGGFLGRDETMEQAVQREIFEESGWKIKDLTLLKINDNPGRPAEDRQNVDVIYVAQADTQTPKENEEITHLQWFDLDKLPKAEEIAFDHYDSIKMYLDTISLYE